MLLPGGVRGFFFNSRDYFMLKLVQSLDASVHRLVTSAPSFHSEVLNRNIIKS